MKMYFNDILPNVKQPNEIMVESCDLFDTITTMHEKKEYMLRKTVERIRNALESGYLEEVKWIERR